MIIDTLNRSHIYSGTHPYFEGAFALAKQLIKEKAKAGKYYGENGVYASVSEYDSNAEADPKFENHHDYIDIQIVVSGKELELVGDTADAKLTVEYKPDVEFYSAPESAVQSITLCDGKFAIFFPGDLHAPGLAFNRVSSPIRKIVVKVPVNFE